MNLYHINALRLGFSTHTASEIASEGLNSYINRQLKAKVALKAPALLDDSPKSLRDFRAIRQTAQKGGKAAEQIAKEVITTGFEWKAFLLERYYHTEYPLREKINLFFQNHFVVTLQSVKVPYWIFKHYETIHKHAMGNYKTLVREMVYSNAMIKYLDNQQNRKGHINENLARELLELFTLGEGHYTESDIKNTALSLAGLTFGEDKGMYRPFLKDPSTKTVFGKSGNFTIDEVIDLIFEQPNTPYLIAEKALKWFFYDEPPKVLITKYGNLLKQSNFELQPFFKSMLTEECQNPTGGHQIKNPLTYFFQVHRDLGLSPNFKLMAFLLKNQGMDIYDQPNVKGWKGGKDWLTSQIYSDRNQFIDLIIDGSERLQQVLSKRLERFNVGIIAFQPRLQLKHTDSAATILKELTDTMIFETNDDLVAQLNQLLKYDFNPQAANAHKSILKVYQYLAKLPEFQII